MYQIIKAEWKVRELFLEGLFASSGISPKESLARFSLLRIPGFSSSQERNSSYVSNEIMTRS